MNCAPTCVMLNFRGECEMTMQRPEHMLTCVHTSLRKVLPLPKKKVGVRFGSP